MLLAFAVFSSLLLVAVNAHVQLQFPLPRGPFVASNEPQFCDGYTNATSNRTLFPLSGGFFSMKTGHSDWAAGILLSTGAASSFDDFKQIKPFFKEEDAGTFCFPLSFDSPNATGLTSGENITIQIEFDGGDGALFQCADLTLSNSVTLSADKCSNATNATSTSSGSTPGKSSNSSVREIGSGLVIVAVALAGLAAGLSF